MCIFNNVDSACRNLKITDSKFVEPAMCLIKDNVTDEVQLLECNTRPCQQKLFKSE